MRMSLQKMMQFSYALFVQCTSRLARDVTDYYEQLGIWIGFLGIRSKSTVLHVARRARASSVTRRRMSMTTRCNRCRFLRRYRSTGSRREGSRLGPGAVIPQRHVRSRSSVGIQDPVDIWVYNCRGGIIEGSGEQVVHVVPVKGCNRFSLTSVVRGEH